MEEYKYKLIEDHTGMHDADLRAFVDQLDPSGKFYLCSVECDEGCFTLTWNWVVPNSWRKREKFTLADGKEVFIENITRDNPKLCPSLEKALWHLAYIKDLQQMPVDRPPENLLEKADILDSYQFIDIDYQHEHVGSTPINPMEAMFYFRKHIRDYTILDAGRDYLEKHKIS